ncbi:MAG TPA: transcription antitermination factor NusB [Burkholderiales bacterium]|nr:transcription antitermination factor NusB [Burkholderiales bacterium]
MKNARHKARELALQGLYQWLLAEEHVDEIRTHLAEFKGYDKADQKYLAQLLNGVIADAAELEAAFRPLIDRPVHELSPVERAVLLIGAYELAHVPDVPYKVVINEAVELAKSYGGTDGHKYVNGVLDKLAASSRPAEVKARKSGGGKAAA